MKTIQDIAMSMVNWGKVLLTGIIPFLVSCFVVGLVARLAWICVHAGFVMIP